MLTRGAWVAGQTRWPRFNCSVRLSMMRGASIVAGMTRLTTPFGFHSTAAEVVAGIDLSGKRMIVTGAASGIGVETARALAGAGAEVTLAVRDVEAGARVAADITATTGNTAVRASAL